MAGNFPAFLFSVFVERSGTLSEKILSIFIDESGDFGPCESHAPFYIVSMILHEQSVDISENIAALNVHINNLGYKMHGIHVGPLIRRESDYKHELMENRKRLFGALFNFARKLPFSYICAKIKKSECKDVVELTTKLSKSISRILRDNYGYFESFDKIIIYYDNGQIELTKIITTLFSAFLHNVEFRKVTPIDYKLFQVADLVCTLELLETKSIFTKSEQEFSILSVILKRIITNHFQRNTFNAICTNPLSFPFPRLSMPIKTITGVAPIPSSQSIYPFTR